MENAANCPYDGESEARSLYLSGRLPEKDAEAFEAHYFDCKVCAEAVEVGAKLRSAFENAPVKLADEPARTTRTWLPLAAAAAVALVAVGVWRLSRPPLDAAGGRALRSGGAQELVVDVAREANGGLLVSWPPHSDAATYVVRVLSTDGAEVWKAETSDPRANVAPEVVSPAAGKSLLIEVEALDARGRNVATSRPTKLP